MQSDTNMRQGPEHELDELMRCASPRSNSVSLLNDSCSSFCDEPVEDLHSASSSRADTLKSALVRTCEAPIDVPSTSEEMADPPSIARVFARRKPTRGEDVRGTDETLLLNLQSIEPLFHLPLGQAAEQLGLCRTALKNVCRKCGITRWPFRGRGRREPSASPSPPRDHLPELPEHRQSAPQICQELASARSSSPGHSVAAPIVHASAASRFAYAAVVSPSPILAAPTQRARSVQKENRKRTEARPRKSLQQEMKGGFNFSSAEPYRAEPSPHAHAFPLSYSPAAGWLVSPVQDAWRLPAPATRAVSEAGSVGAPRGGGGARAPSVTLEAGGSCSQEAAEDVGCDLSFLCLEPVACRPG